MARSMAAVETTPAAAFKNPLSEVASVVWPVTLRVPPTTRLPDASMVVEAVPPNAAVLPAIRLPKIVPVDVALKRVVLPVTESDASEAAPAVSASGPMSIAPKPEVIEPEFNAPVVTRFARESSAVSKVVSVVALIASISLREVVSPPEKMLVPPRTMSPPETARSPVVVAPPLIVSPPACEPSPIVVEAVTMRPDVVAETVADGWVKGSEPPLPAVSDSQPKRPSVHVSMFSVLQFASPAP